jgi:hypothetical protein
VSTVEDADAAERGTASLDAGVVAVTEYADELGAQSRARIESKNIGSVRDLCEMGPLTTSINATSDGFAHPK